MPIDRKARLAQVEAKIRDVNERHKGTAAPRVAALRAWASRELGTTHRTFNEYLADLVELGIVVLQGEGRAQVVWHRDFRPG